MSEFLRDRTRLGPFESASETLVSRSVESTMHDALSRRIDTTMDDALNRWIDSTVDALNWRIDSIVNALSRRIDSIVDALSRSIEWRSIGGCDRRCSASRRMRPFRRLPGRRAVLTGSILPGTRDALGNRRKPASYRWLSWREPRGLGCL